MRKQKFPKRKSERCLSLRNNNPNQIKLTSSGQCWLCLLKYLQDGCLLIHRAFSISAKELESQWEWGQPCKMFSLLTERQQAGTHFLLLLSSSGHTFFVTLRFSLQEIVTKDEDKKTITCPEQLISVSCICMSAKILPYTETEMRPQQLVQGLRALSHTQHKGRRINAACQHVLQSAALFFLTHILCQTWAAETRTPSATGRALKLRQHSHSLNVPPKKWAETSKSSDKIWENFNLMQKSELRSRPATMSSIWFRICGLFHNMGGIGCCLLRNVYVAPQSSGETFIWWETELINWFELMEASGFIRPEKSP